LPALPAAEAPHSLGPSAAGSMDRRIASASISSSLMPVSASTAPAPPPPSPPNIPPGANMFPRFGGIAGGAPPMPVLAWWWRRQPRQGSNARLGWQAGSVSTRAACKWETRRTSHATHRRRCASHAHARAHRRHVGKRRRRHHICTRPSTPSSNQPCVWPAVPCAEELKKARNALRPLCAPPMPPMPPNMSPMPPSPMPSPPIICCIVAGLLSIACTCTRHQHTRSRFRI
jgi:hypothetical protein